MDKMKKMLIPFLLLSSPAAAEPFTYAPEHCEFQITFPEKPFIEKKCGKSVTDCAEVATYTKAIGTTSSTHFRVTCNPVTPAEIEKYTTPIIEETLKQLVISNNLIPYDSNSSETDGYKNSSTISLSMRDEKPVIYNAQIWLGKKSMFTLEGEMVGEENNDIQATFAEVLRNTYPKDRKPIIDEKKPAQ
jgi:hypothetical protein